MPTVLAVDTTATPVSCAVLQDERLLASFYAHTKSTHSQTLMPMIEHALTMNGLSMRDVDALAVNSGPGSFTGVRIGVSAVKGLAFTENKPCVEVSTLACIAEGFVGLPLDAVVCAAMDARCQQVYCALFKLQKDGTIERLTADEALALEELQERLSTVECPVIFAGDGAQICYSTIGAVLPRASLAPLSLRYQTAVNTAVVAMRRLEENKTVDAEALLPTYLRLPQAERELRARQGKA